VVLLELLDQTGDVVMKMQSEVLILRRMQSRAATARAGATDWHIGASPHQVLRGRADDAGEARRAGRGVDVEA
jgi:hypothetical protein